MLNTLIAEKFRNPTGLLGRMAGMMMASGNRRAVEWTVSLLDIEPVDHVLEVGFGPGVGIEHAVRRATSGRVFGIDRSPTMVEVARRRNRDEIAGGRVDLREGDATHLPYANESFDKAFSVHCIYFWKEPIRTLEELRRVLVPGGRLAITVLPKARWLETKSVPPADLFTLYDAFEVADLLERAGLRDVQVEDAWPHERLRCACVTGLR
ncbi:MAG TPA: class I SAM-dependent methyltransferase [Rhodanobacteraceae bacterium]|nr:class I SAM-dependent methyltransferase [Rhodanobacteraceae bacterium]